jgi:hypothetical protein
VEGDVWHYVIFRGGDLGGGGAAGERDGAGNADLLAF